MKHARLYNFSLALVLGMAAGLPTGALADDTEIYLGSDALISQQGQVRPNVLLLLDTSGSMSATVTGTGLDRLDNMKIALKTILDQSNNINVGMMRFTDPGGPILFPVADIDADVAEIEGDDDVTGASDVFARVAPASSDDAAQIIPLAALDPSPVDVGASTLNLGSAVGGFTDETTVTLRTGDGPNVNANTAEEWISSGNDITGTWSNFNRNQIDGIRFHDVQVPQGARIKQALMFGNSPTNFTNTSDALTIHFHGERNGDAQQYTGAQFQVSNRPQTTASIDWVNPEPFFSDLTYPSSDPDLDLTPVVQEIVCMGVTVATAGCPAPPYADGADGLPWSAGNGLGIIVDATSATDNERAYRTQAGAGSTQARQTRLEITYDKSVPAGSQVIGVRFTDIGIPQGATVTSARIEFVAAADSGADTVAPILEIHGHLIDDAPTFANSGQKIDGRPKTATSVAWQGADLPAWIQNTPYQTPDLSAIVQEIVDQPGWCGNNALSFQVATVQGDPDARVAHSSDGSSSFSPLLIIDFDEDSVPAAGGCINQVVTAQVFASDDDAEQNISSGGMSLSGTLFNMQSSQINGLRFRDINIPQGATILEADLTFVSANIDTSSSSITLRGQASDSALSFTANNANISARPQTGASVTWSAPPFENIGERFTTTDIAPIIQEIVNRSGWEAGNDLAIIQTASGDDREAKTFNNSPSEAPRLRIKVQYGGAVIPPLVKTVRERLKEITDQLTHSGFTPLVGQLYEAARYYRGEGVVHGKHRSHRSAQAPLTRLSHPASYTGGTVVRPDPLCTDQNLSSSACNSEFIDGDPQYISPIDVGCQANYIVYLTDGEANHNAGEEGTDHGVSLVESMAGPCMASSTGEKCGRDLAAFLATQDQRPDLAGEQTVKTYTIGFNLEGLATAVQFLQDVAAAGEGQFYEATSAADLAAVFQAIFADILSQPTSFATPSLSVNAFNKLFNRNQVFFSLFEPATSIAWAGNVKKYNVCDLIEFTGCTLGEILDATGAAAIGTDFRIKDSARSVWSDVTDGIQIRTGGAAAEVPTPALRDVFTYTGAGAPSDVTLDSAAHRVLTTNAALTKELLGDALMSDQDRLDVINWIRGQDTGDEDTDLNLTEDRFPFEDPLHASPVAVTYGGTEAAPVDKLFVATNGGLLRLVNGETGVEEWAFVPQELLAVQKDMRLNPEGDHLYGLDLTPTIWLNDEDGDGIVEPGDGDFVRAIQGMRRGGSNLYSLEATPGSVLTAPAATGGISPKLRWQIIGGAGDFAFLGETWSRPNLVEIRMKQGGQNISKPVVIFGAGNDPSLDKEFNSSTIGNGIFIVDAETGALITSIGGAGSGADLEVPGMDFPIPADVAVLDSNGDRFIDRIYAGDLGGNVWRVDLEDELAVTSTGGDVGTAGQVADISASAGAVPGPHAEHTRKFYSAPDVVQVVDSLFNDEARYDLVLIASGSRPDPLNTIVQNTFFAFRDEAVDGLKDENNDGLVDADDPLFQTVTKADLFDVTPNPFQTNVDGTFADPTTAQNFLPDMQAASGWFIDLKESNGDYIGEKGLSKPIVLAGKLFFTTFTPEVDDELINACQLSEGAGRLYGLNVLSGAALFTDWDSAGGDDPTTADRYMQLGGGIPSDAVPIFQKEGVTIIVGGGGGATSVDPGIALPRVRTYWYQE